MAISDQELRNLVRESVARHLRRDAMPNAQAVVAFDASHWLLPVASGSEGDGACFIEPAVRCSHCGYCQSYGH